MNDWQQSLDQSVSVAHMDEMVRDLKKARVEYDEAKKLASEAYARLEKAETQVVNALKATGKSSYKVDDVGSVSWYVKESFTTPKTNEDKTKLFNYIKDKYGPDVLMSMVTIHSATLNSFANKETESGVMELPGLAAPTGTEILSFRKD